MTLQVQAGNLKPLGYQQITAGPLASATSLTVPAGASIAFITIGVASTSVRYRDDGTAPDSTHGVLLAVGAAGTYQMPFVYMGDLTKIQFILASGSPILDILYYQTA